MHPLDALERRAEALGLSFSVPEENRRYSEDPDALDPAKEKEYYRQLYESNGFDLDFGIPFGAVIPHKCRGTSEDSVSLILFGKVGLHCYNTQKGTNLQFKRLEKYTIRFVKDCYYSITLEAFDPASGSPLNFQTRFADGFYGNKWKLNGETEVCRIKPATPTRDFEISGRWDERAVDDFYKGDLPDWDSDDALKDSEHLYKVQDSDLDLASNDCLHLYCEVALYSRVKYAVCCDERYKSFMPLEIKKAYVETLEKVKPIWKARNAIYRISFSTNGSPVESKVIVRKTMDGKLGHMRFETKLLPSG